VSFVSFTDSRSFFWPWYKGGCPISYEYYCFYFGQELVVRLGDVAGNMHLEVEGVRYGESRGGGLRLLRFQVESMGF